MPTSIDRARLFLADAEAQLFPGQGRSGLIKHSQYQGKILLDRENCRIKLLGYQGEDLTRLATDLTHLSRQEEITKVIVFANEQDWEAFLSRGYVLEGILGEVYSAGDTFIMAKFLDEDRRYSHRLGQEDQIIEEIMEEEVNRDLEPSPYPIRKAKPDDIPGLVHLYQRVFETYPTPLHDPEYILYSMETDTTYMVGLDQDRVICAAAAALDGRRSCEMTDCATDPQYRGQGLVTSILLQLEETMAKEGVRTLFSMARARSFGMNLVFRRLDYHYRGRLINHAHICGEYEDLNLWVRPL